MPAGSINYKNEKIIEEKHLKSCLFQMLEICQNLKCKSIAIPELSSIYPLLSFDICC